VTVGENPGRRLRTGRTLLALARAFGGAIAIVVLFRVGPLAGRRFAPTSTRGGPSSPAYADGGPIIGVALAALLSALGSASALWPSSASRFSPCCGRSSIRRGLRGRRGLRRGDPESPAQVLLRSVRPPRRTRYRMDPLRRCRRGPRRRCRNPGGATDSMAQIGRRRRRHRPGRLCARDADRHVHSAHAGFDAFPERPFHVLDDTRGVGRSARLA